MNELAIGSVSISILLSIILRMIYNTISIKKALKPWLAIAIGIALGILGLFYEGKAQTFVNYVNYIVQGFMTGATAVGLYEITKGSTYASSITTIPK